ncbi:hypothetical protein REY90_005487 [Klebsiella pneumoniae]|nr:hypothetical protein [Klebsiella pneumoniae]EKZ5845664.1 hypothetical protein [Klebsiella pneumoniae]
MNTLAALENTFRDMRKHGCQTVMVTQSLADFGRYSYKGEHKKYWGSVSYAAIAGPFPSL